MSTQPPHSVSHRALVGLRAIHPRAPSPAPHLRTRMEAEGF